MAPRRRAAPTEKVRQPATAGEPWPQSWPDLCARNGGTGDARQLHEAGRQLRSVVANPPVGCANRGRPKTGGTNAGDSLFREVSVVWRWLSRPAHCTFGTHDASGAVFYSGSWNFLGNI